MIIYSKIERVIIMSIISLRVSDDEKRLIDNYTKVNDISISEFIRSTVIEKIEDEIDIKLYNQAMEEHLNNPQDIGFDEMMKELGFDE